MFKSIAKHQFLVEELVKRNFKKKYKRAFLGMLWSVLNPLLQLFVMQLVFSFFFGRATPHYTIYLFSGLIVFDFFTSSTNQSMTSLVGNASIFKSVNVSKYIFLLAQNIEAWINFALTLGVYFIFCVFDGIIFTWKFLLLIYPILCLLIFNFGVGMVISVLFVQFKDIQYLYGIFTRLLMYLSAIFYPINIYPNSVQVLFLMNPIYLYIRYFRKIVIENTIPSISFHLLAAFYALFMLALGIFIYKKYDKQLLYYV